MRSAKKTFLKNATTGLLFSGLLFFIALCSDANCQLVRSIDWSSFPNEGVVSESDMKLFGGFDYANRGFGNGPESNHNAAFNLSLHDNPFGAGGRWAKVLSRQWPGQNTVHTFGKAIRAINNGVANPFSLSDVWIDVPIYIPDEWITHDQGKLGYSLTNPDGTAPGTNPTEEFELLFHYFSPNNQKANKPDAPWFSVNPQGPFTEQEMLIGLDAYCADQRVNTNYSEPIFFRQNLISNERKVFAKDIHYVLRGHIKLNTPGLQDGILEAWYSEDGGETWTKSIEVLDFNWRGGQTDNFESEGFVAFRGGSGDGYEVGGNDSLSKNTGNLNAPQPTWYHLGNINLYQSSPFDPVVSLDSIEVLRGTLRTGGIPQLLSSDNADYSVSRSATDVESEVVFEVSGTTSTSTPSSLSLQFESSVFARTDVNQSIELFDHSLGVWEAIDQRPASRFVDQSVVLSVSGDLSRFVEPTSQRIVTRVGYHSLNVRQQFSANVDLLQWNAQP